MPKSKETLEKEYKDWLKDQDFSYEIDEKKLKTDIEKELKYLSAMTVEEYTLYKKWVEIREKFPTVRRNTVFGVEYQLENPEDQLYLDKLKRNIWGADFKSTKDFVDAWSDLEPELLFANNNEYTQDWTNLRIFTSTMKNNNNIGRNVHYIVRDKKTKKYLGVFCMSSDFMDLTPRDKFIGWDMNIKTLQKMINHICIGSTIVPCQPLGYNYCGGKLLALLCISDVVEDKWEELYGDKLVGITTTSLYGGSQSQYDRLVNWKAMGESKGTVTYEPCKDTQKLMHLWLKKHHTEKYWGWYHAVNENGQPYKRDHRNRSFAFVYRKLGIKKEYLQANHCRGIYFCPLFNNTPDFLCKRIGKDQLDRKFDNKLSSMIDVWKNKYAKKRVEHLYTEKRIKPEILFYDELVHLDNWSDVKKLYLGDVGR